MVQPTLEEQSTTKIAEELVLQQYGQFSESLSQQIQAVVSDLDPSRLPSRTTISVSATAYERLDVVALLADNDHLANKIIITLCSLCQEMQLLVTEARERYYYPLVLYEEEETKIDTEDGLLEISRLLASLQGLSNFVERCHLVVFHVVQQLAAIYVGEKNTMKFFYTKEVHFKVFFEDLGNLLATLYELDEILKSCHKLQKDYVYLQRTLNSAQHNPQTFGTSLDQLRSLGSVLDSLSEQVLWGGIFSKCLKQPFDSASVQVTHNVNFGEEFHQNIRGMLHEIELKMNAENSVVSELYPKFLAVACLLALYGHFAKQVDKKTVKSLLDLTRTIQAVPMLGRLVCFPEKFLQEHLPGFAKVGDAKIAQNLTSGRASFLKHFNQEMQRDAPVWNAKVMLWLTRFDSAVPRRMPFKATDLNRHSSLLLQGSQYVFQLTGLVHCGLNLHRELQPAISRSSALHACHFLGLCQVIIEAFGNHQEAVAQWVQAAVDHLSDLILSIVQNAKSALSGEKRATDSRLESLAVLDLVERCLNGPATRQRCTLLRLCLAVSCARAQPKVFKDEDWALLVYYVQRWESLSSFMRVLRRGGSTEFLYWHRGLLPTYIKYVYSQHADVHRLQYVLNAFYDIENRLASAKHLADSGTLVRSFNDSIYGDLKSQLLEPLCRDLETDLRIQTHSHLLTEENNPLKEGLPDFFKFLACKPLRLGARYVDIRAYVANYLGETFYNLATVALHDWKTYGDMRELAKFAFNLETVDDCLPSQTLEQGLDVLEIMRNIHIFVAHYAYNLNNQFFVEMASPNKHLNTINIHHIANSIRTHGPGIMNTAVNFVYGFLKKKFSIFSQFLFDEHIKSRLLKDLRVLRELKERAEEKIRTQRNQMSKQEEEQMAWYPYDRAEKFHRGIRKLGINKDGLSYLDQFRILISHVGNALGYVRMLRSGGLHYYAAACSIVPDLASLSQYDDASPAAEGHHWTRLCQEEELDGEVLGAAQALDEVLSKLASSLAEGADYFAVLMDVFVRFFRDPQQSHLKTFFVIVPPLCVNYVEHMVAAKDRLQKKHKQAAAFTDDGFAVGVAYILSLLDQHREFDSLHWFASVRHRFQEERELAERNKHSNGVGSNHSQTTGDQEKFEQTLSLTLRRIQTYQQEFDLLFYNLSSARIFFQNKIVKDDKAVVIGTAGVKPDLKATP